MPKRVRRVDSIAIALFILFNSCNSLKIFQQSRISSQRTLGCRLCSKNDKMTETVSNSVHNAKIFREAEARTPSVFDDVGENERVEAFFDNDSSVSSDYDIENDVNELLITAGCSDRVSQILRTVRFLVRAGAVGALTGLSVVVFKSMIAQTQVLFYESLADLLPKSELALIAIYPILGSLFVALLSYSIGPSIKNGVDFIARSIDDPSASMSTSISVQRELSHRNSNSGSSDRISGSHADELTDRPAEIRSPVVTIDAPSTVFITSISDTDTPILHLSDAIDPSYEADGRSVGSHPSERMPEIVTDRNVKWPPDQIQQFQPANQLLRLLGAVFTLGSGCSLGPEGPAVEIGTGLSRLIEQAALGTDTPVTTKEKHWLFLSGAAAGVAAGFNAPITGVFFAIEVGNRYLAKNTIKLNEDAPDGPRADIAAIVLASAMAYLVVGLGLHESQALAIQGNAYRMVSPLFELSQYIGMGLVSGAIAVAFGMAKDAFSELFEGKTWGKDGPLTALPAHLRPLLGGIACGVVAVFFPQSLFFGYSTLDQLLSDRSFGFETPLVLQLLVVKLLLTSFCLASGLVGGVFAPALFFGATAGTAYHNILCQSVQTVQRLVAGLPGQGGIELVAHTATFFSIANAPAYATVGAAATLGSIFRAPLTASMLMFELTQNHDIVLPVLVSTGLGGLFAELLTHSRRLW